MVPVLPSGPSMVKDEPDGEDIEMLPAPEFWIKEAAPSIKVAAVMEIFPAVDCIEL